MFIHIHIYVYVYSYLGTIMGRIWRELLWESDMSPVLVVWLQCDICIYIYMYTYVYMYVHMYTHTHIYEYVYIYMYTYMYLHLCIYVYSYVGTIAGGIWRELARESYVASPRAGILGCDVLWRRCVLPGGWQVVCMSMRVYFNRSHSNKTIFIVTACKMAILLLFFFESFVCVT